MIGKKYSFLAHTNENEFLPLSDHQVIVTTCKNAAKERDYLRGEKANYKSVTGLPRESTCRLSLADLLPGSFDKLLADDMNHV